MDASTHRVLLAVVCFAACCFFVPERAHAQNKRLPPFVQTQLNHAKSSFAAERYDEAIELLDETIKLYPTIGVIYSIRGAFLQRVDRHWEAVKDFSRAISNGLENSDVYTGRALSKHQLGLSDGAILDCTTAINLDSKSTFAFAVRGQVRTDLGQYDPALNDLDQAILIDPRNELAYMIRAICKLRAGDEIGSANDFAKYEALEALAKGEDMRPSTGELQSTPTEQLR